LSRWGIVGGGMLGMTLAHRLAHQGKHVTLIEAAPHLGGLASAWRVGDVVWDRHYHVTLLSDSSLRKLLAELGLESEIEWSETRTGVFAGGRLHSVSNALELLRFPVLGWMDVMRLGATILWASRIRNWERLEQVTVSEWLMRWSGQRTFERFWLPLLRSKLGDAYRETSAAFIWATIQRLYAARRTRMKKEMFGTVRGGYARVLERFAERLGTDGVRMLLRTPVARVEASRDEVSIT
jgi:protoporphyrinogen oxidase